MPILFHSEQQKFRGGVCAWGRGLTLSIKKGKNFFHACKAGDHPIKGVPRLSPLELG